MNETNTYYPEGLTVTVAPAEEPITPAEVKLHTKVDTTADDSLIALQIKAAREYVENVMGIALVTQTIKEDLNGFPFATEKNKRQAIRLKRYPVSSIASITYKDADGNEQTLDGSTYIALLSSRPPIVSKAQNESWPTTNDDIGRVSITYVAGYGSASDVPSDIKQMLLLMVADWYDNRENSVQERFTAADKLMIARRGFLF